MLVCKGQDARQKKNPRPCTPSSAQDLNGRRSHQHLLLARPRRVVLLEHPALATERPQNEVIAGFRALCEMGEKLNRSPAVHIWHPVGTRESEPSPSGRRGRGACASCCRSRAAPSQHWRDA